MSFCVLARGVPVTGGLKKAIPVATDIIGNASFDSHLYLYTGNNNKPIWCLLLLNILVGLIALLALYLGVVNYFFTEKDGTNLMSTQQPLQVQGAQTQAPPQTQAPQTQAPQNACCNSQGKGLSTTWAQSGAQNAHAAKSSHFCPKIDSAVKYPKIDYVSILIITSQK